MSDEELNQFVLRVMREELSEKRKHATPHRESFERYVERHRPRD